MTDDFSPNSGGAAPASAPAPSTLTGDAATARQAIDAWRGVPGSPFYTGIDGGMSADAIQQLDRDLIRGELAGASGAVGLDAGPDRDLPLHEGGYDVSGAANARSMTGDDRTLTDSFMPWAFAGGLGQQRFQQAVGWVLSGAAETLEDFRQLAHAAGWSARQIKVCTDFHAAANGAAPRDIGGRFTPAPAAAKPNAARKAEIESEMYLQDGRPGPYWANAAMQHEYRQLIAAELGG